MATKNVRATKTPRRRNSAKKKPANGKSSVLKTGNAGKKPRGEPRVLRAQAVWLKGRVPLGFWQNPENRRLYLRWLGQTLGFRRPEDWYRITTDDFRSNYGGGALEQCWGGSAVAAVKEYYPDYDWKGWLFGVVPRDFWHDPRNRRRYLKWLAERLGIRHASGWYQLNHQDFKDHHGDSFLRYHQGQVPLAIMSNLPNYDWKPWMFRKAPKNFWQERKNRKRYLTWLGKKLGFQSIDDWHRLTEQDFFANYGRALLAIYGGSPIAVLRDLFPKHTWNEWRFAKVPIGFWDKPANRRRYLRWLGRKLKVKSPADWRKVTYLDFFANCGSGLVARYGSHLETMRRCIPGFR